MRGTRPQSNSLKRAFRKYFHICQYLYLSFSFFPCKKREKEKKPTRILKYRISVCRKDLDSTKTDTNINLVTLSYFSDWRIPITFQHTLIY